MSLTVETARTGAAMRSLRLASRLGPLAGLAVVYALFAGIGPESFSTLQNLETRREPFPGVARALQQLQSGPDAR